MSRFWKRFGITSRVAFRNCFRNKRRSMVTLIAVIIGVSSTIALAGFARGMAKQLTDDSIFNLTGHIKIQHLQFADDPAIEFTVAASQELLQQLKEVSGVQAVIPRLRVAAVINSERESRGLSLIGIDRELERGHSLAGVSAQSGQVLQSKDDGSLFVGHKLLQELKTKLRRRVVVMTQDTENELADRGFRIAGVFQAEVEATEKQFAFTGIEALRKMVRVPEGHFHEVSLVVSNREQLSSVKEQVEKLFPEASVKTWEELQPLVVSMVKLQSGFLFIWFGIVIITAGFGLVNSLLMSIFERVRELAIMNALGMTRMWIVIETVLQSFFLLLSGGIAGVAIGLGIIHYYSEGIDLSAFSQGTSVIGVGSLITPLVVWSDIIAILFLLITLGTLGCLYPAWHAAKVKPSRALQRL